MRGNNTPTRIRVALAEIDKNQVWLARQLGVPQAWLSRRMTGAVPITVDDLTRIARVVGVPTTSLIQDEGMTVPA